MVDEVLRQASTLARDGRFDDAAALLEQAARSTEVPVDRICARLATVHSSNGNPTRATAWAVRTVDGGTDFGAWRSASRVLDEVCPGDAPGARRMLRVGVLSTANVSPLVPCLRLALARGGIGAALYEAPFGHYWHEPLDVESGLRAFDPDVVVFVPDFRALSPSTTIDDPAEWLQRELSRWTDAWRAMRSWSSAQLVQLSFVQPEDDPYGLSAAALPASPRARLRALDLALARAATEHGVAHVDVETLAGAVGKRNWFDARYWHVAKQPFSMSAAPELALRIAATVIAHQGMARKALVVDLDNTLWHGVIGDDGLSGIELTGPRGEAHVDFQHALRALGRRGIILAACSKNDPTTARLPFTEHPDMILGLDDFAAFVANWEPKPDNLRELSRRLAIPLDSFVFVDDNQAEREAVRQALPEVDVVALASDPAIWRDQLARYPWFEPARITEDDRRRVASYQARAAAADLASRADSLEEFHRSLDMRATIGPIDSLSFDRAVQLVNKTNQFNLTGRRHSAEQVRRFIDDAESVHLLARLEDRFADHGIVAVLLATGVGAVLDVDTFVMSCRVIGRGLETALIEELVAQARRRDCELVRAHYVRTERNDLVSTLWSDHGFQEVQGGDAEGDERTYELRVADYTPRSTSLTVRSAS